MEIPANFCLTCGDLVEMPPHGDMINCNKCGSNFPVIGHEIKPIVSSIVFDYKKDWVEEYLQSKKQVN